MHLYVCSDESGVFDKRHNEVFVFGGLVFLCREDYDECARRYVAVEKMIRKSEHYCHDYEMKACRLNNSAKYDLYKSLNKFQKFGVVIDQKRVLDNIFQSKKDRQRYLDYAYKIGVKRKLEYMIRSGVIIPDSVDHITFLLDEHTTATNGYYELRESLEQEYKRGTYNKSYSKHFPPIFNKLEHVDLEYCNSSNRTNIRAADIVANRIYYLEVNSKLPKRFEMNNNLNVCFLP